MKIYIMTDMEGLSGVADAEYMKRDGPYFRDACRYLMGDLNAAIAGAFDGGATEVYPRDGHHRGNNFILDELDSRAVHEVCVGNWYGRLDKTFAASFFIGAHAMSGARGAFMCHTQCPDRIFEFRVNGRAMGELGQWALGCGHYGVPLALVVGDEAACQEAQAFFPGVETVAVKQALGWSRAQCYPIAEVRAKIRAAAARAVCNLHKMKPFVLRKPLVCEQVYTRPEWADAAEIAAGYKRVDGRTCRKAARNQLDCVM